MYFEYPKMIWPDGKSHHHDGVIVRSRDEEERALGITPPAEVVDIKVNFPSAEPEDDGADFKNSLAKAMRQSRPRK